MHCVSDRACMQRHGQLALSYTVAVLPKLSRTAWGSGTLTTACMHGQAYHSSRLPKPWPRGPKLAAGFCTGHPIEPRTAPTHQVQQHQHSTLESLKWDHTFVRELPGDPDTRNAVRQVLHSFYSLVQPTPAQGEPHLVAVSKEVCELLDLDPAECLRPEFPRMFSGKVPVPGAHTYAQCYGGHQFGTWAGQLGDGRVVVLGEVVNSRGGRWEVQLKGAGRTPYSRHADGRAVMRSSVREYVVAEAMHHLGVPTTRSLSLVGTGDAVLRDMFYNGNAQREPGAVVARAAPSFVRFGTFQLPVSRGGEQHEGMVRQLADYVIRHHYNHLEDSPTRHADFFREVCERTARLVAAWQCLGFVHGVLNTDNMSVLGLTIDYGPFGFLDKYDPGFTPNLTDYDGKRYAYRSQPQVVMWNCVQLGNALIGAGGLLDKAQGEAGLEAYAKVFSDAYTSGMAAKLGLRSYDAALANDLLQLMYDDDADFTSTFRALSAVASAPAAGAGGVEEEVPAALRAALGAARSSGSGGAPWGADREAAWLKWLVVYKAKLRQEGVPDAERAAAQDAVNPKFVPRQHLLQYAIEGCEVGDFTELEKLMEVLKRPYADQPDVDPKYSSPPPEEMIRPGVCMLSCSS